MKMKFVSIILIIKKLKINKSFKKTIRIIKKMNIPKNTYSQITTQIFNTKKIQIHLRMKLKSTEKKGNLKKNKNKKNRKKKTKSLKNTPLLLYIVFLIYIKLYQELLKEIQLCSTLLIFLMKILIRLNLGRYQILLLQKNISFHCIKEV